MVVNVKHGHIEVGTDQAFPLAYAGGISPSNYTPWEKVRHGAITGERRFGISTHCIYLATLW